MNHQLNRRDAALQGWFCVIAGCMLLLSSGIERTSMRLMAQALDWVRLGPAFTRVEVVGNLLGIRWSSHFPALRVGCSAIEMAATLGIVIACYLFMD